jgi:hypothetical protein
MIVINVTEWIVDLLICGVAVVVWSIGFFMIAMLCSMLKRCAYNWRSNPEERK